MSRPSRKKRSEEHERTVCFRDAGTGSPGRFLRPIRLSTFLLLTAVAGLLIALYARRIREAQNPGCDRRLQESGHRGDHRRPRPADHIDLCRRRRPSTEVLKEIGKQTTGNPKLPRLRPASRSTSDPIGLQEAELSLNATVKRPTSANTLTLGEHIRRRSNTWGFDSGS